MTNKGNSNKIKRHYEPGKDWIQFSNRSEIRNKCQSRPRKKHRNNKTNQHSQTKVENNLGRFKKDPYENVGSNLIVVKPKTRDTNIMGLEMSSILLGSTITDQSLCTKLSCQTMNKSVKEYDNDDSNNTEKYEAIILKNICITGKKLSLWKKIKYRFKSLTSEKLKSQADILTTKKSSTKQINNKNSKGKKDFGIERKLEHYTKLKSKQPFLRDYLVMHCQKADVAHSKNSVQKDIYFKTPITKNQSTQKFSKSRELLSPACVTFPVISFPENEEEIPKNSIITTLTQKLLQLTEELASKIFRSATNMPCDCKIKSSVSDNLKKSECIEALCIFEDKYTQPSDNSKKKKLCFRVDEENSTNTSQDTVVAKYIKPKQASKSLKNSFDKKQCDCIHDCTCIFAKKIESSEKFKICKNINEKQNHFRNVTKNLKNDRTITEECFKIHDDCGCRNLQTIKSNGISNVCKNINQNSIFNNVTKNLKNDRTITEECFKKHDDCGCKNLQTIKSNRISNVCKNINQNSIFNNVKKNVKAKAKNRNKCIKLHKDCECRNAMSSKTPKPCKDLNQNVRKNRCTNAETTDPNNGTCKNIQQNQVFIDNAEKNVKKARVNIFKHYVNCKTKRISPELKNNTAYCTKINSKKDSRVLETADPIRNIDSCNKKKQKHIKVRSKSTQYLQTSKISPCDVRKSTVVGKSCNNSNVGLDASKYYPDKCNSKIIGECVRIIPKSRYTQHSTCSNPRIMSTKAQCGDNNAEYLKNDRKKCSNISERCHIAKIKQNNCIPQASMAETHKLFFDKACFTISQDHCSKACFVNLSKPCHMKKPVKSCKQNKTKPGCEKKSVHHCKNKLNKTKLNKHCKKCCNKHFCIKRKCKAICKKTWREIYCALKCLCKLNCGNKIESSPKCKENEKHIYYDLNCNELFLDTLKQKPRLFFQKTCPTYQDFLKCCCMWSECTQMICIFTMWCPFVFMFEIFRRCFCYLFD